MASTGRTMTVPRRGRVWSLIVDNSLLLAAGTVAGLAWAKDFTVALFFASSAFPPGALLDQAKMGALLSLLAAPIAIVIGRLLRIPNR